MVDHGELAGSGGYQRRVPPPRGGRAGVAGPGRPPRRTGFGSRAEREVPLFASRVARQVLAGEGEASGNGVPQEPGAAQPQAPAGDENAERGPDDARDEEGPRLQLRIVVAVTEVL